jgi:hypothetical protein
LVGRLVAWWDEGEEGWIGRVFIWEVGFTDGHPKIELF